LEAVEAGDIEAGTELLLRRLRAEESIIDRILGLPPGSIQLAGSDDYIRSMIVAWQATPRASVATAI
jgi:hypothetical protein